MKRSHWDLLVCLVLYVVCHFLRGMVPDLILPTSVTALTTSWPLPLAHSMLIVLMWVVTDRVENRKIRAGLSVMTPILTLCIFFTIIRVEDFLNLRLLSDLVSSFPVMRSVVFSWILLLTLSWGWLRLKVNHARPAPVGADGVDA